MPRRLQQPRRSQQQCLWPQECNCAWCRWVDRRAEWVGWGAYRPLRAAKWYYYSARTYDPTKLVRCDHCGCCIDGRGLPRHRGSKVCKTQVVTWRYIRRGWVPVPLRYRRVLSRLGVPSAVGKITKSWGGQAKFLKACYAPRWATEIITMPLPLSARESLVREATSDDDLRTALEVVSTRPRMSRTFVSQQLLRVM